VEFLNSNFPGEGKKARQARATSDLPVDRQASIRRTRTRTHDAIIGPVRPPQAMVGGMSPPRRTLSMGSGGAMGRRVAAAAAAAAVMSDSPKPVLSRSM